jgi:serine/threonine protein kinase
LSLDEITCILKQYLEFLKGWHSLADICHNLNASKLIYQRASRTLTVLDYGSARRAHLTDQSNPQTTINHQPPEFFLKRKNTAAVDRWGLGCILYYLLTGTDLFPLGSGISEEEQNHYVFQRIVQRIGWPTPQYLQKCQNTDVYFDDQRRFRKNLPVPRLQNWRVVIEQTFSLNNWPTHEMNGFISIIDNVVCYKNRSTPESLLKHRLFNNEIVLHLNYNPSLKCTMYIRRFSILNKPFEFLLPSDIFAADLTLDFKQPIDECLHIPRDPLGKYVVMLEKNGFFLLYGYDFNSDEPLDVRHIQEKLTFSKPLNNYGCRV